MPDLAALIEQLGEEVSLLYVPANAVDEGEGPMGWTVSLTREPMIHSHFATPEEGVEWLIEHRARFGDWQKQVEAEQEKLAHDAVYAIEAAVLFRILDHLRLGHVYALKDSPHADRLGPDFKPEKWRDYELDFARRTADDYRALLDAMEASLQRGQDPEFRNALGKTYMDGVLRGIEAYAWMKDGTYYVGTTGKTLADALEDAKALVWP